jgi:hypothetical protein
MPLSRQISDHISLAIIAELRASGFNVIGQEYIRGRTDYYRDDLSQFYKDHNLDKAAAFVWLSQPRFAEIVNERKASGQDMSGSCFTGWLFFAGMPGANAAPADTVGQAMAVRLKAEEFVTLTPQTASALKAVLAKDPLLYCTYILRAVLWLLLQRVRWSRRPLMIALRRNGRQAKLRHLRIAFIAHRFVPQRYRKI